MAKGPPPVFGGGSISLPEGLPFRPVRQGTQFHEGGDVLHPPARPGLLQSQVQQLLDRSLHQAAADRLPPAEPQRVIQAALMAGEVIQDPAQGGPVAAQPPGRRQPSAPLHPPAVAVGQEPQLAPLRLPPGLLAGAAGRLGPSARCSAPCQISSNSSAPGKCAAARFQIHSAPSPRTLNSAGAVKCSRFASPAQRGPKWRPSSTAALSAGTVRAGGARA